MLARYFLAALLAGILAGIVITPIQHLKTTPLIVAAETYEDGGTAHDHATARPSLVSPAHAHGGAAHEESGDVARLGGTLVANVVIGATFSLLILAASLGLDRPVTLRNGAVWGLAGFAAVTLAPALGLPPELPAMPAADLAARQAWWLATVALTAGGLWLLVSRRSSAAILGGLALLLLPHLVGAPHPADLASPVPAALAAEFAVASLSLSASLWAMTGALLGLGLDRARRAVAVPA
ncbi:CbtA family protein [Aureimonas phyllosphaerae]|uniref:Cobalt transporter subunit CbtA n=1 Tax=Aureimonas phyllosphaerae TaxID=1166078 RepID=A0A7W6FUX1_9HYPH|nr:CbtA family protein [Aureimonas phyllosphaerae]MBB3936674.1 cobalt transporter subunit CbtA [Aureimonas phyllosphaerae]MBB3960463.1 cobalt transporter subunit CbtA [Aureimonas phyllosphaerae]SFF23335.1 cobalt transporter subunit CbtA [Aureimonas phyllosphaerae]